MKLTLKFLTIAFLLSSCSAGLSSEPTLTPIPNTPIQPTSRAESEVSPELLSPLDGGYTIHGKNPDGTAYQTTLDLHLDQVFSEQPPVIAYITTWGDGTTGYGLLVDDALAISFGDSMCRPGYYINEDDMTMNAVSLTANLHENYQLLTPTEAITNFDGSYIIHSEDKDYNTQLTITNQGSAWHLSWTGNHPNEGIGLGIADYHFLAVSSGGKSCGVRFYKVANDGSLDGAWALNGVDGLGSEIGTR